jgi:hypothetical protein
VRRPGIWDALVKGILSDFVILPGPRGVDAWETATVPKRHTLREAGTQSQGPRGIEAARLPKEEHQRKKFRLNSIVAGAVALMLLPGTASAASSVEVTTHQGITWVEAAVDTKAEKIQIRIEGSRGQEPEDGDPE